MALVVRLLWLLTLLLMPCGMAAVPAAPVAEHRVAAASMKHCNEEPAQDDLGGGTVADCAMPCSTALPAADLTPELLDPVAHTHAEPTVQTVLADIELEIATPPPKQA